MDHGYFQGQTSKLKKSDEAARPLPPYVDAVFLSRGIIRANMDPAMETPIILRVFGGNSMVGIDLANEEVTTSVEEII
jgi:3-hydroxy-5-phosphonooxypentane-2,4-dione thiolase